MPQVMKKYNSSKPHPVSKYSGGVLRAYRLYYGLTQQEIADILGVKFQMVQKLEKGINRLNAQYLTEICNEFNISMDEFHPDRPGKETKYLISLSETELRMQFKSARQLVKD